MTSALIGHLFAAHAQQQRSQRYWSDYELTGYDEHTLPKYASHDPVERSLRRQGFKMSRIAHIDVHSLSDEQKQLYYEIGAPRDGKVGGPFPIWLQANPDLADRMNKVGEVLRVHGALEKRLFEIAVLCVARYWKSNYQWSEHAALALRCGVSQATIDTIRDDRAPSISNEDERLVFGAAFELLSVKRLSPALYDVLLRVLGFRQLVELVTIVGQYSMAAIVMLGFEVEPADGSRPLG